MDNTELEKKLSAAEKALRETELKLHETQTFLCSVLEGIGDAVVVLDRDMRIISANSGYLKQTNRPLEGIIGRQCYAISHGLSVSCDKAGEECAAIKSFSDGLCHHIVHKHLTADGNYVHVKINAFPLKDAEGNVYAVVETLSDITKSVHLQQRLRESEERFRNLYNNAPDLMHSVDDDGYIIECNDTALKTLGYERAEYIGKLLRDIFSPEYHTLFDNKFNDLKQNGFTEFEANILDSSGNSIRALVKSAALYNPDGRFIKSSTAITNIEELRRLEDERKLLAEQLLQAQKMEAIGTLAAGIAHDFNNMLVGISGFSELAYAKTDSKIMQGYLTRIIKIADQAAALTGQILIIGKKASVTKKHVDIKKFITNSVITIRRMVEENIIISVEYGPDTLTINADEGQLYQVLLNLVVNARDAMPGGGKINIKASLTSWGRMKDVNGPGIKAVLMGNHGVENKPYVLISVEDTGTGIPSDIMDRIFEPFFTTKDTGKGTGLGLSVIYSIVQDHEGCIEVRTGERKGAAFRLFFPALEEKNGRKAEIADTTVEIKGNGRSVLVVDDEEIVRVLLSEILIKYGFQVTTADSGEEAVNVFAKHEGKFDLVILDKIMPGMSGVDVYKKMFTMRPGQKVVLSTGYALQSEIEELQDAGLAGVIKKPFKITELMKVIKSTLEKERDEG